MVGGVTNQLPAGAEAVGAAGGVAVVVVLLMSLPYAAVCCARRVLFVGMYVSSLQQ